MAGTIKSGGKLFNVRELALAIAIRDGSIVEMLSAWEVISNDIIETRAERCESIFQTKTRLNAGKWAFYTAIVHEFFTASQCGDIARQAALETKV